MTIKNPPNSHSILYTTNYKTKKYKIKTTISSTITIKLYPKLILIKPNFYKYKKISEQIHKIFHQFTNLIKPLNLNKTYLNITQNINFNNLTTPITKKIKRLITKETGLTASAGVAPNKFLAKVASDWNKPNGIFVVPPEKIEEFVLQLPLQKIPGVGKVTLEKLHQHHLKTCADVLNIGHQYMSDHFGKMGRHIHIRSQGIDDRPVTIEYPRKSLSIENTFSRDISDDKELLDEVDELIEDWFSRLIRYKERKNPNSHPYKFFIKIKTFDFQTHTVEQILPEDIIHEIWNKENLSNLAKEFFHQLFRQSRKRNNAPLRLIGLGCRFNVKETRKEKNRQLNFLEKFEESKV